MLVYWWSSEVDLALAYFRSTGCVWELAVTEHERAAWIRQVLAQEPDLGGYLANYAVAEVGGSTDLGG